MAFRASGLRPSLEMTPPDLAAMDLLYQLGELAATGGDIRGPGWRAKESTGSGGPVLSLLPPRGIGISVLVTSTAPPDPGAPNPSTSGCRPVRVGGLEGSWCQDTTSMVVSTTLQGRERWYVLTTSLQQPAAPAGAYDRVLASFRLS
jgi:hypothetical protein